MVALSSFEYPPSTSMMMLCWVMAYPGYFFLSSQRGGASTSVFSPDSLAYCFPSTDNSFLEPGLSLLRCRLSLRLPDWPLRLHARRTYAHRRRL